MRDAGRLHGDDVRVGERDYAEGDRIVLDSNDRRLDVVNGDPGHVLHAEPNEIDVKLDRGPAVQLPAHHAAEHLDHGYAITAHKAQARPSTERSSSAPTTPTANGATPRSAATATPAPSTSPPARLPQPANLPAFDGLARRAAGLLDTERRQQLALELARSHRPPTPAELQALIANPADDLGPGLDLDNGIGFGP